MPEIDKITRIHLEDFDSKKVIAAQRTTPKLVKK